MSADGSILATLWSNRNSFNGVATPVVIFSQGNDGSYVITEEHSNFMNWDQIAISSDGQLMAGTVEGPHYEVHFFYRIESRYQLMNVVDLGPWDNQIEDGGIQLCITSGATIVFVSVKNSQEIGYPGIVVLEQSTQNTWSVEQTLTTTFFGELLCSGDGSLLFSVDNDVTDIYSGPKAPQASPTATSSPTKSPSASSTITSTFSASMSTSASPFGKSSSLSSTLPQSVTITISVLSTTLFLLFFAMFAKWYAKYRTNSMHRDIGSISERSETLLRVN
jgi:hypothetical protein